MSLVAVGADLLLCPRTQPLRIVLAHCGIATRDGQKYWVVDSLDQKQDR